MNNFIKQKAISVALNRNTNYFLIGLIVICVLSYMYFANMAVRTVTYLENSKQEMQSLSVKVSELESNRFALENSISAERAMHLGFLEVKEPTFIMKDGKKSLTLKN